MRIISKERDYYDFAGYWQSDILYVRKTENVEYAVDKKVRERLRNVGESVTYYSDIYRYYLLICGTVYVRYFDIKLNEWVDFINDAERKRRASKWYNKYYDTMPPTKEDIVKIHQDLNAPIVGLDTRPYKNFVVRNPILVEHDFTEIQPDILHRDIEFFISNDLRVESAMPEFSDIAKLEQHGFDKKSSFRNSK